MAQSGNQLKLITERISKLYTNLKKSKSRFTRGYIQTRLDTLTEYWSNYCKHNDDICQAGPEVLAKFDAVQEYEKTENLYLDCKTLLMEALYELPDDQEKCTKVVTTESTSISRVKLPPINIPRFAGKYEDWISFRDLFTALVNSDERLSNMEKYHYLRSSVCGDAETAIKNLAVSGSNFDRAWSILENRYDNKRIIVNNVLNRFFNQRKLTTECARGLKELLDTTTVTLDDLQSLSINTSTWDVVIIHIVVSKLDLESHKLWEQHLGNARDITPYATLKDFLEGRVRSIESIANARKDKYTPKLLPKNTTPRTFVAKVTSTACTFCQQDHYICHCNEFKALEVPNRQDFVKKNNLCFNCLVKGHSVGRCRQLTTCKLCRRRHHTLLHLTHPSQAPSSNEPVESVQPPAVVTMKAESTNNQVILATARVIVTAGDGATHELRALIDPGSQASFVTESTAQILNLKRVAIHGTVTGISNDHSVKIKSMVNIKLHSIYDNTQIIETPAYVLSKITSLIPSQEVPMVPWPLLQNLPLADPHFQRPGTIDVLLGADVHARLIIKGLHRYNMLLAQNSRLGWLISGQASQAIQSASLKVVVNHTKIEIDQLLRKFWELEEHKRTHIQRKLTKEDIQCEEHFKNTTFRNPESRYVVSLPFKENSNIQLGDTRPMAASRLHQIERRFKHKPDLHKEYCKFMQEYEALGHMQLDTQLKRQEIHERYYLPHHAILKESSTTTKLRVVFDGSAKPEKGKSLNEELLIGPPLQQDIRDLVTRWRMHKVGLVADIKQMYRQILIRDKDTHYQRILWRANPDEDVKEYRLLTVTYGTSCAPYLAIRTLHQLAEDEHDAYPDAAPRLKTDLYMDDILTGTSTDLDTIHLQKGLDKLLSSAGFKLHKWASNSEQVLNQIPGANITHSNTVSIQMDDSVKALGIRWNPRTDCFELKFELSAHLEPITKRNVLSTIAKTFDPLGWLAPIVITLKIFMQRLWLTGLDWDDVLPTELQNEWCTYYENLNSMRVVQLPRWLGSLPSVLKLEIHGFADASCVAYACVTYLRVVNNVKTTMHLITARSKVAPVKQISLPRLELCGAVLLAKTLQELKASLSIHDTDIYAWTDSTIVLAWLRKNPNTWSTFIGNRTAEILNVTSSNQWHHVESAHNPADVASRGLSPAELQQSELWWSGPAFLKTNELVINHDVIPETDCELKHKIALHICTKEYNANGTHLDKYSSLSKLIRVTAYCLRFITKCKEKVYSINKPHVAYLTASEINNSLKTCIRMSQHKEFKEDIDLLLSNKSVKKSSPLYSLNPFVDEKGLLRVGGRLVNAQVPFDFKSPSILSSRCPLTKLIIEEAHIRTLHGGFQLTLNTLNFRYYIIGGKRLVKKCVRNCIPCFKQRALPKAPFMGNLPQYRVKPARSFSSCGVDFAGPFSLKLYSGRCNRTSKAYISLFVCTVTKAIHLELVENLSSTAFIAAFKRFTARRGHCSDMYSDCGTNFQGASKELAIHFKNAQSELVQEIAALLANDFTTWHFNPPAAPHFGGLWEAGVKTVKGHLKRVIGQSCLTFNEFYTLLTQVEACVNSRPLTSTLDGPTLTPGHFLLGENPIVVPEENVENKPTRYVDRWQRVQLMLRNFWRCWQREYLTTLQHRYKWTKSRPDIDIGTVVLVKDNHLPPGKWLLSRVIEKHPGADGITRVVTLQFKNHTFKRPVTKLCPLPLDPTSTNYS